MSAAVRVARNTTYDNTKCRIDFLLVHSRGCYLVAIL
jgi:hypothetical protein